MYMNYVFQGIQSYFTFWHSSSCLDTHFTGDLAPVWTESKANALWRKQALPYFYLCKGKGRIKRFGKEVSLA